MSSNNNMPPNLEGLATLLVLQDQVKHLANLKEFGYFVTNETHRLIHYNTAYLWKKGEAVKIQILDQSEIAEIDVQSPVSLWLKEVITELLKLDNVKTIQSLDCEKMQDDHNSTIVFNSKVLKNWPVALPKYLLWTPFLDSFKEVSGGLILFREKPFSEQEVKMFRWLANNYQYTWLVLTTSKLSSFYKWYKEKPYIKILSIIILLGMFIPTRLSVVANATVESSAPAPINAPTPGIIKEFLVKPGDLVKAGQLLMVLDKNDLIKSVAIAQKKVLLTSTKLRSATNQGYDKSENRDEIPIWEAELAVDQSELDYAKSMLAKTDIKSPIDGVAVFESKEDWIGQPVQAGENIMNIEDPNQLQLEIFLPVADLITLEVGSEGKFFVYGSISPIPITLSSIGYNAKLTPSKVLAYEYKANFLDPAKAPRIGSQGTAHLYGQYVPFIYYLLRRPLQAIRQTFGF